MADTTQEICRSPAQGQVQHFASHALTSIEETLRILCDVWPSTAGNSPKRWMGSGELGLKIIDACEACGRGIHPKQGTRHFFFVQSCVFSFVCVFQLKAFSKGVERGRSLGTRDGPLFLTNMTVMRLLCSAFMKRPCLEDSIHKPCAI
jgi:hypothetical protein